MAATLHVNGLTVRREPQLVLDAVSFTASPGQCIGLVGPNGVGKSTLLGALAGVVDIESGSVQAQPGDALVGWLPQEAERRSGETVAGFLARRCGIDLADAELHAATASLAAGSAGADDRYGVALDRWLMLGSADFEARTGEVWHELGLAERLLDAPTTQLSGGEAARAGLAALVLSRYDLYLLDEPTNDLDLDGLERLERWVRELDAAVVVVSHDRTFLENVVTDVIELDEFSHRAGWFAGGWASYLEERSIQRRHARERFDEYDTKRRALQGRAERERNWATQGVAKAKRKPSDGDKSARQFKINQTEQLAGRAARTQKAMERLEVVAQPQEPWQLRLSVGSPGRSGDVVAQLTGAVVDHGAFVLGPIDLEIAFGERIAVLGANGSGKTTLIDTILGRAELRQGSRRVGPSVVIGEVGQARRQLQGSATFLRDFTDVTGLTTSEARTLVAKFGLGADHVTRPTATFSPGERTRAALALLMANGANCLVLDEPTNHLDLPAIEQLEAALAEFNGTVILVSHDRTLLATVPMTRTLRLADGRIVADDVV